MLSAYVTSVDPKRLASAKRRLLMLRNREVRIHAVYAAGRLQKQGHDVADLRPLLDAPLEAIAARMDADEAVAVAGDANEAAAAAGAD